MEALDLKDSAANGLAAEEWMVSRYDDIREMFVGDQDSVINPR